MVDMIDHLHRVSLACFDEYLAVFWQELIVVFVCMGYLLQKGEGCTWWFRRMHEYHSCVCVWRGYCRKEKGVCTWWFRRVQDCHSSVCVRVCVCGGVTAIIRKVYLVVQKYHSPVCVCGGGGYCRKEEANVVSQKGTGISTLLFGLLTAGRRVVPGGCRVT